MSARAIPFVPLLLLAAALLMPPLASAQEPEPERPNIVLILADDLGYGDLGCYGSPDIRTPRIDALAREGMRFTSFYSNGPECTPTRAALLTGRYPQRVGGLECAIGLGNVGRYDDAVRLRDQRRLGLPPEESVIPRMLNQVGYQTALVGKWHLGYEPDLLPARHGWSENFGPLGGAVDYFTHHEPDGELMLYRGAAPVSEAGYLTDLLSREATAFIRRRRTGSPFFLYLPFTAPHDPYQAPDEPAPKPGRKTYRSMVERLDLAVGRVLDSITEAGLAKKTLVIFTSDNGGAGHARNAPFSRGKGTTYEGGIRVPLIVRWPEKIERDSESHQVGATMDLTRSIARIASADPGVRPLDGVDLLRMAEPDGGATPRTLFWRLKRGARTRWAVRAGDLKLVRERTGDREEEHLFDLSSDPAEQRDLLPQRAEEARLLGSLLRQWEREVMPPRPRL